MLQEEFKRDESLREAYERLSFSKKKEIRNQLADAKKTETIKNRLVKIVACLRKGKPTD